MARSSTPAFHYPKPEAELSVSPVHPQKLRPIKPPSSKTIRLDEEWIRGTQTVPFSDSGFTRSTHVIPAATPRDLTYGLSEEDLPADKEARQKRVAELSQQLLSKKQALERGEAVPGLLKENDKKAPVLVNVLDRYVITSPRRRKGEGLTLVLAHANGFPRRIWEPFLATLIKRFSEERRDEIYIEEIWSFESANHGDGAFLNDGKLGDTYNWADNARDILNFILHFMPSNPDETGLPRVLDSVSLDEASRRSRFGFPRRKLVGIGHSLGGCSMARAAIDFPSLFSSLVLVDPVIIPSLEKDPSGGIEKLQTGAVSRRTRWSSRDEALEGFRKTPFFQSWNPSVLEAYVNEGIAADKVAGGVKLKQSGFQEACVFAERRVPVETWELLESLHERVHLFWAMSGRRPVVTGPEDVTQQTVWRRPKNASNVRIEGAGHLIVHEAPELLAQAISDHLWTRFTEIPAAKL